jgi:hypothetical protein
VFGAVRAIRFQEAGMIYFLALMPATGLTVAGYFALYLSHRSEGAMRAFGRYLGFWAFTLAGLVVLGAIFAAAHGGRGGAMIGMRAGQGGYYCPWQGRTRYYRHPDVWPGAADAPAEDAAKPPAPATPPAR